MYKKFKRKLQHFYAKIKNLSYKKKVSKEKKKIYLWTKNNNKYKSKRNRFRILKNKIEFDNYKPKKELTIYYYLIGIFLILSSIYVITFSHYFSVKNIDIIREDDGININIAYKAVQDVRFKSLLLVNEETIKSNLYNYQKNIKDIKIKKIFPNTLQIKLSSYPSMYLTQIDWKYFKITSNWVLIWAKENEEITKLKVKWLQNFWVLDYKKIFEEDEISKIKAIETKIKEENSFILINKIIFYKNEKEIHIISKNNTRIIFDLTKDIDTQIKKINIFYKEYASKIKKWIIYIDLRINERIFYCSTENEYICYKNLKLIYED